jgi:hypothetical protein
MCVILVMKDTPCICGNEVCYGLYRLIQFIFPSSLIVGCRIHDKL